MIALYKGISFTSRIIKIRTWSEYSHASWTDDDESIFRAWKEGFEPDSSVIESWHIGGVRYNFSINIGHTPGTVIDLFSIDLTPSEREGLREFLLNQVGKKYDFKGCLNFITRRKESPAGQKRWFCSELVFAGFVHIRKPLLLRIPAWKVYPGLLAYSPLLRKQGTIITQNAPGRATFGDLNRDLRALPAGRKCSFCANGGQS